ncbi:MAG: hypothetical protein PWQ77_157 [Kosmotogales bacterium]|nr:hypothetical protein [Kosmotogales bacterium]
MPITTIKNNGTRVLNLLIFNFMIILVSKYTDKDSGIINESIEIIGTSPNIEKKNIYIEIDKTEEKIIEKDFPHKNPV